MSETNASESGSCARDGCNRDSSGNDRCYWHQQRDKQPQNDDLPGEGIPDDLSGAYLSGVDLSGADLSGVDLSSANLTDAVLEGADLSEATVTRATLTDANLTGADLFGATAYNVFLDEAELQKADLREADLERAVFEKANLREANLTGADCESADFTEAILRQASLETTDLMKADFSNAYLFGTRFTGARIDGQTQFGPDGPISDLTTDNICRYDSSQRDRATVGSKIDSNQMIISENDDISDSDYGFDPNKKKIEAARARRATSTYRRLEILARQNGFPSLQSEMFIRRQDARRELLFAERRLTATVFAQVQKWLFNYGESFKRITGISAGAIIFSWALYSLAGISKKPEGTPIRAQTISTEPLVAVDTLIYSVQIFFSGNGSLETTGRLGQAVVSVESMIGPILLALLIFVLGRRAAR